MHRCDREGCGWQAIAPTGAAAAEQFARHLVAAHGRETDADVPEGMVQVRTGEDDEWTTMTLEEAKAFHATRHGDP